VRVAAKLGIPFLKLNFVKEYKETVLKYMYDEYKKGRTPNPDVMCNRWVKFGFWLEKARELGFDKMATGHYANLRITDNPDLRMPTYYLCQAKDKNKDQTYFLHQLNQEQLSYTLFPLGNYTKDEVRVLAKKFDLPTANKEESMGICFVGEVDMKDFLQHEIKPTPGKIILSDGTVLGEHIGLPFYTIGQRHVGVLSSESRVHSSETKPLFVVDKLFENNELVVGCEDDPLLFKKEIEVEDVNWIAGVAPKMPFECEVRMRHRQEMQKCLMTQIHGLYADDAYYADRYLIKFEKPQRAVTPGQFCVFYMPGDKVLCGKEEKFTGRSVAKTCLGGGVVK